MGGAVFQKGASGMMKYPSNELMISQTLWKALRLHYVTLKHVVVYALLIALTKSLTVFLIGLYPGNEIFLNCVTVVFWLLIAAFVSFSLYVTHQTFIDKPVSFLNGFRATLLRFPKFYFTVLLLIVGAIVIFYFGEFLMLVLAKLLNESSPFHKATVLVISAMILAYVAIFSFLLPLTIMEEKKPLLKLISESVLLSEKNKFGVMILFMLLLSTILLLLPGTLHEEFFKKYHVDILFDFVVLAVMLPIILNFLLLIINDSKRQLAEEAV